MSDWEKDFGEARKSYISAKQFDGEGVELTYQGYSKVEPDDLDFIISGTQNKVIKDSKSKAVLTKDGKEIPNSYYDAKFPNGYQIQFEFDEGTFSCTSFPCLKEMHRVAPEKGDRIHIRRDASVVTQTKYFIRKVNESSSVSA